MKRYSLLLSCLFLFSSFSYAQLIVSKIFSDHAVLQRDISVPVWGTSSPFQTIQVNITAESKKDSLVSQDELYTLSADSSGFWKINLNEHPASGPYTLNITTSEEKISFKDIWFGDVWLCSGQSNMEWTVTNSANPKEEISNANDPMIRHFKVPRTYDFYPQDTLAGGNWEVCSPETAGDYTAVGYYFARAIRTQHNIPIGLLNSTWGGSRIEAWMPAKALGYENATESANVVQSYMDSIRQTVLARLEKIIGDLPLEDLGMKGEFPLWASPDYSHVNWKKMTVPGYWESNGYPELDGVVWYRKEIFLDNNEVQNDISFHLGPIDDSDITYLNGEIIGQTEWAYNKPRVYKVPSDKLKPGVSILTVRIYDGGGGGGFAGPCEELFYKTSKGKQSLCGDWSFNIGQVEANNAAIPNQFHTLLYNRMIHPILDFPIKGAIWYQGESNADFEGARAYKTQFPDMINSWRGLWNQGDFPFLWVQLANFLKAEEQPTNTGWARLREAQSETLKLTNTAQAVIIDIGDAEDIHPKNKQDVGYRLALGARKLAYGEELVHSGPVYQSMKIIEHEIHLQFELYGSQLATSDNGAPKSFAISGPDGKFVWADARIEGNKIIVWSKSIPNPIAVRYAWGNNPADANVYNSEGIPASPFQTNK